MNGRNQKGPENRPTLWFVCPAFGGTSEVWMYRQAVGLGQFSVRVFTNKRENADRYPFPTECVTQVPHSGRKPTRIARLWRRARNFRRGCSAADPAELRWWARELAAAPPDIIFCQYGETGAKLTMIADRLRIPVVTQFNGYDASQDLRRLNYRLRLRWALPRMAGCVAVASYQLERLARLGLRRNHNHARLIPYGVPMDEFPVSTMGSADVCRFLTVGRFVAKKAPNLTIRAFARCADQVRGCQLRMLGDGPLRAECESLVHELGISQQVTFLGSQPIDVVKQELASASVFVQHSVTALNGDMEGWPVAVAEACASGLPIVATRHAGIVDQVVEGKTGFLVDEGDWQRMAQNMIALAQDANLRTRMGAASRRHIETFDFRNQIEKLELFLLEFVDRGA